MASKTKRKKRDTSLGTRTINGKFFTRASNHKLKSKAKTEASKWKKRKNIQNIRIIKTTWGWSVFLRWKTGKKK